MCGESAARRSGPVRACERPTESARHVQHETVFVAACAGLER